MSPRDASTQDPQTPISEQAAYWWVTLRDGECADADRRAFAQWVTRSPERVEAYLRIVSFMAKLRSCDLEWPDDASAELIAAARAEGAEIVQLPNPMAAQEERAVASRRRPLRRFAAVAALVSLAAVAAWLYFAPPHRYQTGPGERRTVSLADGSLVTLNPSTAIDVDFRHDRRLVRIPGGQALFQVARETARPFEVMDERVIVRAVGTRFHVDCRPDQTTVAVLEGRVAVRHHDRQPGSAPLVLSAADQVVVQQSGRTSFSRLRSVRIRTTGDGYRLVTAPARDKP